jgi:hypothetical protein
MQEISFSILKDIFTVDKIKGDIHEYLETVKMQIKYLGINYYPFQVDCIVGDFKKDNDVSSLISIEKFVVQLFYDYQYSLITVDFIHY